MTGPLIAQNGETRTCSEFPNNRACIKKKSRKFNGQNLLEKAIVVMPDVLECHVISYGLFNSVRTCVSRLLTTIIMIIKHFWVNSTSDNEVCNLDHVSRRHAFWLVCIGTEKRVSFPSQNKRHKWRATSVKYMPQTKGSSF